MEPSPLRSAGRYLALGLEVSLSVAGGIWIGTYLDRRFGTAPLLTLVCLLLGSAAAFLRLYRVAAGLKKERPD